ncbi:hypothetical protein [Pontibacillus yanchengensis]|uniref:Uncharacterized protein n=1 Tax=Pontibacillus yanchengensis Y32 TaxID=1385514 RepID=A0A0A2TQC2_9BACI|nr:hypothetical protein [Pontibacillus yanchengensis]KGP71510.1 hypothetical protein N782_18485 [Pontibacillus yanchengensis Y32]
MRQTTAKEKRELQLIQEASKLQMKIDVSVYPFINEEHPAHRTLQNHMIKKADLGDYSLIESVNEKVTKLTKERVKVMNELNELRRKKGND